MKRQIRISVCIAFLAVMLANPAWADEFVYKQIAVLEYGTGDNQIGLIDEPEAEPWGPTSFWVTNAGHICILDNVNHKIKIFSASGKLLRSYDIDFGGNELAVDESGNMFVYDPSRRVVEHINKSGKKLGFIEIDMREKVPHDLRIRNGDVVFSMGDRKSNITIALSKKVQGKTRLLGHLRVLAQKGMKGSGGEYFSTFLQRPERKAGVFILNEEGEKTDKIRFPIENAASICFLGEDQNYNSYFQFEISDPNVKGVVMSVYYLDIKRHLHSAVINMPNNYFVWTSKLTQVDDMGNIYQVLPTEDNVQINVWQRRENGKIQEE